MRRISARHALLGGIRVIGPRRAERRVRAHPWQMAPVTDCDAIRPALTGGWLAAGIARGVGSGPVGGRDAASGTGRGAARLGMLALRREPATAGRDHGLPCRCVVAGGWGGR
jgi:hypothetical protein